MTGNGFDGKIPDGVGGLVNLEELTLSRNQLSGEIPLSLTKLKKLKVLDLSHNCLVGNVPEPMGNLSELLKLDLSCNGFTGKIPEGLKTMQELVFLDLSFNRFGNFGIPLFLSDMPRLKEVYLSGNRLGGKIPEIWDNLGGVTGIGFSGLGLVGNIPASLGLHLKSLCYLWLDNNELEGTVPEELGILTFINEMNLENNSLSGRVPFSASLSSKMGHKLRLGGNPGLCVDESLKSSTKNISSFGLLKLCNKPHLPNPVHPSRYSLASAKARDGSMSTFIWLFFFMLNFQY